MIDNQDPTWWKHYKTAQEETHITDEQLKMTERGMIEVGKGKGIPICKNKVEEARKEMREEEWNSDKKILDSTAEEYDKIFADRKLYEFQRGKAAGPDGWKQEGARVIINCDKEAKEDYKQWLKTCFRFEVKPIWNKRTKVQSAFGENSS